jgi:ubiquinone/menaquinone biosynthesis C-methylase UbiE
MMNSVFFEIHQGLPRESPGRRTYTLQAFQKLPIINHPKILDIGCGTGPSTLVLAEVTNGTITAIDVHQPYLDILREKAKKNHIETQLKILNQSMEHMNFPDDTFDIIWSEGSIYIIGFQTGLQQWKRFLKPNGFLVVHEMCWLKPNPPQEIYSYWKQLYPAIATINENLKTIKDNAYTLVDSFSLPEDAWWIEYYQPLEKRIKLLRKKFHQNHHALQILDREQEEIDLYRKYSQWYGSAFFIMQKPKF